MDEYNPSSSIHHQNADDHIYLLELTPLVSFPIQDHDLYQSILQALQSFHLDGFLNKNGPISLEFIKLVNSPIKMDFKSPFPTFHALVYYLTGIFGVSVNQMVVNLQSTSPINLIMQKLYTITPANPLSHPQKQEILNKYASIFQLGGYEFINRLYDLVNGNEGFLVIVMSLFILNSLSKTFIIPGFENFHMKELFEDEMKVKRDVEVSKKILENLQKDRLETTFPKLSSGIAYTTNNSMSSNIDTSTFSTSYGSHSSAIFQPEKGTLKNDVISRFKGQDEREPRKIKTNEKYNYLIGPEYEVSMSNHTRDSSIGSEITSESDILLELNNKLHLNIGSHDELFVGSENEKGSENYGVEEKYSLPFNLFEDEELTPSKPTQKYNWNQSQSSLISNGTSSPLGRLNPQLNSSLNLNRLSLVNSPSTAHSYTSSSVNLFSTSKLYPSTSIWNNNAYQSTFSSSTPDLLSGGFGLINSVWSPANSSHNNSPTVGATNQTTKKCLPPGLNLGPSSKLFSHSKFSSNSKSQSVVDLGINQAKSSFYNTNNNRSQTSFFDQSINIKRDSGRQIDLFGGNLISKQTEFPTVGKKIKLLKRVDQSSRYVKSCSPTDFETRSPKDRNLTSSKAKQSVDSPKLNMDLLENPESRNHRTTKSDLSQSTLPLNKSQECKVLKELINLDFGKVLNSENISLVPILTPLKDSKSSYSIDLGVDSSSAVDILSGNMNGYKERHSNELCNSSVITSTSAVNDLPFSVLTTFIKSEQSSSGLDTNPIVDGIADENVELNSDRENPLSLSTSGASSIDLQSSSIELVTGNSFPSKMEYGFSSVLVDKSSTPSSTTKIDTSSSNILQEANITPKTANNSFNPKTIGNGAPTYNKATLSKTHDKSNSHETLQASVNDLIDSTNEDSGDEYYDAKQLLPSKSVIFGESPKLSEEYKDAFTSPKKVMESIVPYSDSFQILKSSIDTDFKSILDSYINMENNSFGKFASGLSQRNQNKSILTQTKNKKSYIKKVSPSSKKDRFEPIAVSREKEIVGLVVEDKVDQVTHDVIQGPYESDISGDAVNDTISVPSHLAVDLKETLGSCDVPSSPTTVPESTFLSKSGTLASFCGSNNESKSAASENFQALCDSLDSDLQLLVGGSSITKFTPEGDSVKSRISDNHNFKCNRKDSKVMVPLGSTERVSIADTESQVKDNHDIMNNSTTDRGDHYLKEEDQSHSLESLLESLAIDEKVQSSNSVASQIQSKTRIESDEISQIADPQSNPDVLTVKSTYNNSNEPAKVSADSEVKDRASNRSSDGLLFPEPKDVASFVFDDVMGSNNEATKNDNGIKQAKIKPIAVFSDIKKKISLEIESLKRKSSVSKDSAVQCEIQSSRMVETNSAKQEIVPLKREFSENYQKLAAFLDRELGRIIAEIELFDSSRVSHFFNSIENPGIVDDENINPAAQTIEKQKPNIKLSSPKLDFFESGDNVEEARSTSTYEGSSLFQEIYTNLDKSLREAFPQISKSVTGISSIMSIHNEETSEKITAALLQSSGNINSESLYMQRSIMHEETDFYVDKTKKIYFDYENYSNPDFESPLADLASLLVNELDQKKYVDTVAFDFWLESQTDSMIFSSNASPIFDGKVNAFINEKLSKASTFSEKFMFMFDFETNFESLIKLTKKKLKNFGKVIKKEESNSKISDSMTASADRPRSIEYLTVLGEIEKMIVDSHLEKLLKINGEQPNIHTNLLDENLQFIERLENNRKKEQAELTRGIKNMAQKDRDFEADETQSETVVEQNQQERKPFTKRESLIKHTRGLVVTEENMNNIGSKSKGFCDRSNDETISEQAVKEKEIEVSGASEIDKTQNDAADHMVTINVLKEMFPHITTKTIEKSVEDGDGDQDKAIDILLNYNHISQAIENTKEYSPDVSMLKELFPILNMEVIEECFKENDHDTEKAVEALLTRNVIQEEFPSEETGISAPIITKNERVKTASHDYLEAKEKNGKKMSMKTWSVVEKDVNTIQEYTGLSTKAASALYHKNFSKVIDSIVDAIKSYSPSISDGRVSPIITSLESTVPKGGRVQNGSGKFKKGINSGNTPSLQIKKYDAKSPKSVELSEIYHANDAFHCISKTFMDNALIFFQGDVNKVIDLARFILENDGSELTLDHEHVDSMIESEIIPDIKMKSGIELEAFVAIPQKTRSAEHTSTSQGSPEFYLSQSSYYSNKAKQTSSKLIASHYNALQNENRDNYYQSLKKGQETLKAERLREARSSHNLDLHNFSIETAIETVDISLREWWVDELKAREIDGKIKANGYKATFVEPLIIITGRGIHSRNGTSTIRKEVKNYLNRNGYLFDENQSLFSVSGKRGSLTLT